MKINEHITSTQESDTQVSENFAVIRQNLEILCTLNQIEYYQIMHASELNNIV